MDVIFIVSINVRDISCPLGKIDRGIMLRAGCIDLSNHPELDSVMRDC